REPRMCGWVDTGGGRRRGEHIAGRWDGAADAGPTEADLHLAAAPVGPPPLHPEDSRGQRHALRQVALQDPPAVAGHGDRLAALQQGQLEQTPEVTGDQAEEVL